ncbi:MAG: hypothetical protein R8M46_02355 [Ghiorsea sp.]
MEKIKNKPVEIHQELTRSASWSKLTTGSAQDGAMVKQELATQLVGFPSWITSVKS